MTTSRRAIVSCCAILILSLLFTGFDAYGAGSRRARSADTDSSLTLLTDAQLREGKPGPGSYRRNVSFKGDDRFYELFIPSTYRPGAPVPLVMILHGGGGTPNAARKTTGFDRLAEQYGFIALYPAGTGENSNERQLTWNILVSQTYATRAGKDDLGFIRLVLDDAARVADIDATRIYATGISQGGMMCYRFACDPDLSGRIAAIAPVAAVMTVRPDDCKPSRPMPIIHFHGMRDEFVPYEGGIGPKLRRIDPTARPAVPETLRFWIARNRLGDQPRERGRRGVADFEDFGREGQPGEFVFWRIEDGGHTWPGGESLLPEFVLGKVNRDINATTVMWQFFQRHRLR